MKKLIACDEYCYFKSDELNNKEKYIKQYPKEMKKCGMCDKKKEDDGHYCCEDCGGISF